MKKHMNWKNMVAVLLAAVLLVNTPAAMYAGELSENVEAAEAVVSEADLSEELLSEELTGEEFTESVFREDMDLEEWDESILMEAEDSEEDELEIDDSLLEEALEEAMELDSDTAGNSAEKLKSYGLPVINLVMAGGKSVNTINKGSKSKEHKVSRVDIFDKANPENSGQYENVILKGHGNSSWGLKKKAKNGVRGKQSYQIKFDKKQSLFGMKKAKKYLLVSNYIDIALIRNKLMYDIAESLNFSPTKTQFIDLYINGKYIGNYMLCQKVEIGSHSVDLNDPNAIIAEIDHHPSSDDIWMKDPFTRHKISVKDTDTKDTKVIKELLKDIVAQFVVAEKAAYAGASEANWEILKQTIDVESFAKYYLLNEFSNNVDTQRGSFYIYKDGPSDIIHAGPLWDQDLALGRRSGEYTDYGYPAVLDDPRLRVCTGSKILSKMMMFDQFRAIVSDLYFNSMREAAVQELNVVDELAVKLRKSADADHKNWKRNDWYWNVKALRKWMVNRIDFMDLYLGKNVVLEDGDYLLESATKNYSVSGIWADTQAYLTPFRLKNRQVWHFQAVDHGDAYVITNASTGLALCSKKSQVAGTAVVTRKYGGGEHQKWRVVEKSNGTLVLINKYNGLCLNTVGGKLVSGAKLKASAYRKTASRQWKITPYSSLVPKVTLTPETLDLKVKKSLKIKATGVVHGDKITSWKSSNTKVAKVSSKGTVTAGTKEGTATITVTLRSGVKAKVTVTVHA